jgi:1-acyl-sn-glycerol-3-phosphate acyltransferase
LLWATRRSCAGFDFVLARKLRQAGMIAYKIFKVCCHLVVGLWTCALIFPLTDAAGRAWRIKRWSLKLIAIFGVKLEIRHVVGAEPVPRAMIVCNHICWLDIFVINSWQACRFVAKSDVRSWPLIGRLVSMAGTIFIARGRVRDVRKIFEDLVASLHAGEHVAFFPEGTTATQGMVLPFHANLFEAAIDAGVPIQPFALRYVDGDGNLHSAVEFIGDTSIVQSMAMILRAKEITAQLVLLPVIETDGAHRRELALASRRAIVDALDCL